MENANPLTATNNKTIRIVLPVLNEDIFHSNITVRFQPFYYLL